MSLQVAPVRGNVNDISQSREEFDADQFLFDKKSAIEHFFSKVHEQLASTPSFALHFFLSLSKLLAKEGDASEQSLDILRKALQNISHSDIEVFIFYETEMALQIVRDLYEPAAGRKLDGVDRETHNFAVKIRNCPHYRIYSQGLDAE